MQETSPEDFDSGVIVTCVEDKYIGYLLGADDNYLYMRFTHKMVKARQVATPDSVANVAAIIVKRPVWVLRIQVAKKFLINPMEMTKESMAIMLAEEVVEEAIEEKGPIETYVPQPQAVKIALAHGDVIKFESLTDVTTAAILTGLDFAVGSAYNEEYDTNDTSTGTVTPEDH